MAKRKRSLTTKKIEMWIKEGRSCGDGKDYIPWYKISDVASKGVSLKTFSMKVQRQHHLLSRLETCFFYIAEWSDDIVDIKEQYALDLDETKKIAIELGIKHPTDPRTKTVIPITTDFVLTQVKSGDSKVIARTVKYSKDLNNKRVLAKFDIEKAYWERHNVDWGIFTEQKINKDLIDNIIWVRKAASLNYIEGLDIDTVIKVERALRFEIFNNNRSISEIALEINDQMNLISGTVLYVVRFLISNKIWIIDMYKRVNVDSMITLNGLNLEHLMEMRD